MVVSARTERHNHAAFGGLRGGGTKRCEPGRSGAVTLFAPLWGRSASLFASVWSGSVAPGPIATTGASTLNGMSIPGDKSIPVMADLGEGHVLLESAEAILGSAVWCWQALLFRATDGCWICGLSQVLVMSSPTSFDGPQPVRVSDGEALFDFLFREWPIALESPAAPSLWLAVRERLRVIDEQLGQGFERALKSRIVSRTSSSKGKSRQKADVIGSCVVDLAVIEERLRDIENWTSDSKNALIALHKGARQEAVARKKLGGPLGPFEQLECSLFGDPKSVMDEDDEHGQGFSASLMDGTSVDIFDIAGIECSDELHDRVWGNHNWESILGECDAAFCMEVGEQDDRPMMSDTFYWVSVDDPIELARQLREFIALRA